MAEPAGQPEQPLGVGHVEDEEAIEGAPALLVRRVEEAQKAQGNDAVARLHAKIGAGSETVALREGGGEEHRALVGEEGREGGVAHRAPAEVAAERPLGQGVDAQHAHRLSVEVEGGHHPFHHRRARAQAVLDPEEAIDVLGQAARTPAHLVGGAARDGLGAAGEAAAGGLVGEVDGHHHRHPQGDAQDHEARVQRPAHEIAQAGAKEGGREHDSGAHGRPGRGASRGARRGRTSGS